MDRNFRIRLHNFWLRFNGDLTSSLSALALFVAVAGLAAYVIVDSLTSNGPALKPVTWNNPYLIREDVAPVGGTVTADVEVCNNTDEPVSISSSPSWQKVENGEVILVPAEGVTATLEPGCHQVIVPFQLPPSLTPGHWIRVGVSEYVVEGERFTSSFFSEEFEVVEAQ